MTDDDVLRVEWDGWGIKFGSLQFCDVTSIYVCTATAKQAGETDFIEGQSEFFFNELNAFAENRTSDVT